MQGLVISKNADLFTVESDDKIFKLKPTGKTKASGIYVGDNVEFDSAITRVLPRKNLLIRPPLANLDTLFIVIAPLPKPDLVLVDKILIYCMLKDIKPILVVNKIDIAGQDYLQNIKNCYHNAVKIIECSSHEQNISELEINLHGISALVGQSAVGKSSLINSLHRDLVAQIGDLAKKIERGKQTTRLVRLYKLKNGYLADTAGFSMLDLSYVSDLDYRELSSYYLDFLQARANCKYRTCLHENDVDCGVIKAVKEGEIALERYKNYLKILEELKSAKKY